MVQKCEFYLPIKKRGCKFEAKPGFKFCGNHMPNSLQPKRKRIPCPWDPAQYDIAACCTVGLLSSVIGVTLLQLSLRVRRSAARLQMPLSSPAHQRPGDRSLIESLLCIYRQRYITMKVTVFQLLQTALGPLQAQGYCQQGVNAGPSTDALHTLASNSHQQSTASERNTPAQQRHHYVQALGQDGLVHLVQHIDRAHKQVSLVLVQACNMA